MGIGLADGSVNMNRLPGWEKDSYGYHGDDGNSFCSSGNGKKYGPTFTTGDVIGVYRDLVLLQCTFDCTVVARVVWAMVHKLSNLG